MTIQEILQHVDGRLIFGEEYLNRTVEYAFTSDLMSDVLTLPADNMLLITGLNNIQAIRTAEMADINQILFVRDKKPTDKMVELARENGIVIISTAFSAFHTGGILYASGLKPVF